MRTPPLALLAVFGLGIAAAQAAPPTQNPGHGNREPGQSMSRQQREQLSALVRHNTSLVKQPKTQQEAAATRVNRADGTSVILVPESLWNNLSVQHDAHGNTHVREGEGTKLPATSAEGAPNE